MDTLKIQKTIGEGEESVYVYHFDSRTPSKVGDVQIENANRWPCKIGYAKGSVVKHIIRQQASMIESPTISLVIKTKSGNELESFLHTSLKARQLKAFGNEWFMTNPTEVETLAQDFRKENTSLSIGEQIRLARIDEGLTQIELAKASGLRQETISLVENGSNVSFRSVEKISSALCRKIVLI
jgi:DNA-binding XRE family transcriptional regulator